MKKIILLMLLFGMHLPLAADQLTLDQLLQAVKQKQGQEGKINKQREARFLAEKNNQKKALKAVKAEEAKLEKQAEAIRAQLQANEAELQKLTQKLQQRSGDLGELFGVARQVAGDLKADLETSLISAQFPQRTQRLEAITSNKRLPTLEQLEFLWFTLLQEMTESGKVVEFQTEVLSASGEPRMAQVHRIGKFNAFADNRYLNYIQETGKLVELARQPDSQYLSLLEDFSTASSGLADIAIDPTRGAILNMLIQRPNVIERIQQGGVIGYIILFLGALGLAFGLFKLVVLILTENKVNQQINRTELAQDNPLGRVLTAAESHEKLQIENFELLLDEAVTKEVPALEQGLPMLKLLAAVAPLLGLLGTVTGMIATFQSISLFGTGDPKLMAGGISQALVTTTLGLLVAIPLLFLHSLVASRSRMIIQVLDEQAAGILSKRAGK